MVLRHLPNLARCPPVPGGGRHPLEALATYATHAAFADNEGHRKVAITPGMLADLVLIDHDPASLTADELLAITVATTVLGGEVVSGAL